MAGAPKIGPTDEALVERVRDRDGAAFDTLFGRYFGRIHRFVARRLRNSADVEATVEDIFVQMLLALDAFRGEASFAAWLHGLARRTLAQHEVPEAAVGRGAPTDAAESEHAMADLQRGLAVRESSVSSLLARARRLLLPR